jgi:hypothetical protein
MRRPRRPLLLLPAFGALFWPSFSPLWGQAIEFESGGLRYQTLTREGLTIMFAHLPARIREYTVVQVAISNGSPSTRAIQPEDFRYVAEDGVTVAALPARAVVERFLQRAGRNDVINLVSTYEMGLYGLSRFQSTSGYEQRRQAALAEVSSVRLKAAAAASAIAFVPTKLKPGESTDGAIFFPLQNRPWGPGKLIATPGVEYFEFEVGGLRHPGDLIRRP